MRNDTELPTGLASVEAGHNYERRPSVEPTPDAPKVYEGHGAIEEAANDQTARREAASEPPLTKIVYKEELELGKKPSTSAEDAARALSAFHREQNAAELAPDLINLQQEVDYTRAVAAGVDPQLAAQALGQETTQAQQPQASEPQSPQPDGPQPEGAPEQPSGLSPKVAAALADPEIRAAIEPALRQSAEAAQAYTVAATEMAGAAMASVLASWPELQGVPANQLPAVLNYIGQQDPEKAATIKSHIDRANAIYGHAVQAHQQQQAQQQAQQRAQFEAFAKQQDEIFTKATADESPETRRAVSDEVVKYFAEFGIDQKTLAAMWHSSPLMRSAAAQTALHDAMRYRMAQRGVQHAAAKPIPNVQKPGVPRSSADRSAAQIGDIAREFRNAKGNRQLELAVKLQQAKRAARG